MLYPFAYSSNASLSYLCKIIYNRPGVAFSQSPNHFCHLHQRIHLSHSCRISVLTTWMLCLPVCFLKSCCVPITLVYISFISRSIFLALNTDMHWTYQGNEITKIPEGVIGFVYLITNTTNGRMYIGKKLAKFKRSRPPLKGRKNKRRYKVNSDWQDYYGSSDDLTIDVNRLGKDKFKREILFFCRSKAELSYVEAREQFARKVLESNDYYNGHIRVRVHGKGILKS